MAKFKVGDRVVHYIHREHKFANATIIAVYNDGEIVVPEFDDPAVGHGGLQYAGELFLPRPDAPADDDDEQKLREAHGPNADWPPGAPKY